MFRQPNFYPPPLTSVGGPPQLPPRNPNPLPPPSSGYGAGAVQLKCIGKEPVLTKYTQFFVLKASDSFGVCNNCYRSKVAPHQGLVYEFKPYHTTNDEKCYACDFSLPRIQAIFRAQCIPRNTVQPLLDFVRLSEKPSPCDGSIISTPGPYYETRNQAVPGLAVCPTCFECFLRYTSFENEFKAIPDGTNGGTRQWTCDMAMPFFRRLLTSSLESAAPDFAHFIEEANARLQIPQCPGPGQPITQFSGSVPGLIFTAAGGKTGNICFACYCDCVSDTSLDDAFVPAKLAEDQLGNVRCDLAEAYSKMAIEFAIKNGDDEIWRSAVGMAGKVGACRGKRGTDEEELAKEKAQNGTLADWYHVTDAPSIEVCPHCYWLKIKLFGAAQLFSPIIRPLVPGIVRMCYLTGSNTPNDTSTGDRDNFEDSMAWRGRLLFNSLRPGYEVGDWSSLVAVSKSIAMELPPCGGIIRGFRRPSGRKWFGRVQPNSADPNDCTVVFCEECHSRAVKGTLHAAHFSQDLTDAVYAAEGNTGFVCQTYTNRSRATLRDAAQRGDFAGFARWWNHRDELRKKKDTWKPILELQLAKQSMANFQQGQQMLLKMNAQANALSRIGSAGVVEAAMGDPGVRWGNSQVSCAAQFCVDVCLAADELADWL
jgi:hypothetical protein